MKLYIIISIWFQLCFSTEIPDLTAIYHVGANNREIPDLTAVYHVGANNKDDYIDIHLRTDALGLPVAVRDRLIEPEDAEFHLDSLNLNDWKHEVWSLVVTNSFLDYGNTSIPSERSQFHTFYDGVQFNITNEYCSNFQLILTVNDTMGSEKDFIWINGHKTIFRCAQSVFGYVHGTQYNIFGGMYVSRCTSIGEVYQSSCPDVWHISQENGVLKLWDDRFESQLKFTYNNFPHRIQFYQTYFSSSSYYRRTVGRVGDYTPLVYALETNKEAKLISPPFIRRHKDLCFTIIFYTEVNTRLKSIKVYAEDMISYRTFLGSIDRISYKASYWHAKNFITHWPDSIDSDRVRLLIEISVEGGIIRVERIQSCNSVYGEDVVLLQNKESVRFSDIRIPISSDNDNDDDSNDTDDDNDDSLLVTEEIKCQHGRRYGLHKCACPPGFVGTTCEKGCGENRFGKDCSGKCSIHPSGCSGLFMCTLVAGCFCAPGYEGKTCEQKCSNGTYGNSCSHKCGHCKEEMCNIYTGECSACRPGYQLPLCQIKYDYTRHAPMINLTNFGEVIVMPDIASKTNNAAPLFYTIQYKRQYISEPWISHSMYSIPRKGLAQSTVIRGLQHGVPYSVRTILIDGDFNSYKGNDIPAANFTSLCIIPENPEYHVDAVTNKTSFTVSWQYVLGMYWCPVEKFEVSWTGGWKWITDYTDSNIYAVSNLLPGTTIKFKVRAVTKSGSVAFSSVTEFSTKTSTITEQVQDLKVKTTSKSARISWNPPFGLNWSLPLTYRVTHKCMEQVACQKQCGESSAETLVRSRNVSLDFLYPMSQYLVSVSAEDGPVRNIVFGTKMTAPVEVPEPSSKPPVRTNASFTVFWNSTDICSSFFSNYVYQVYKADNTQLIQSGSTQNTSETFGNLQARTDYKVLVYIQTLFGDISYEKYLAINVSTLATVPDQIQNLTVYKSGRHMLGLRWAPPVNTHGIIVSYTIKYGLGENVNSYKTETVMPSPCVVWPHLFCHTVTQLQPDRQYTVIVSAKNAEVDADGMPSEVYGITKEKTPGPPENLKLLNSTSNGFSIQWDYPWLANGTVRTFLTSIEETEVFEEENCCQIYPLFETAATEELEHYVIEVSGLHAASTYIVSVSAKTVLFGPSQAITIHTRPPPLPIVQLPIVKVQANDDLKWWPQNPNFVDNLEVYKPLVKGSLILVVSNDTGFDSPRIQNERLNKELKNIIPGNFYVTAEYTDQSEIQLGTDEILDSIWGTIHNTALRPLLTYQLAVMQLTEYCGVYNFDIVWSAPFVAV